MFLSQFLLIIGAIVLVVSEIDYLIRLLRRKTHPVPLTWTIWAAGALCVVWGVLPEMHISEWDISNWAQILYPLSLFVCTFFIALFSWFLSKKREEFGSAEMIGTIGAVLGIGFIILDFMGMWRGSPELIAWALIAAALIADGSGWFPTYRSVQSTPEYEPMLPWVLTVISGCCAFFGYALLALSNPDGDTLRNFVFSAYYNTVNMLVLYHLVVGLRKWRSPRV